MGTSAEVLLSRKELEKILGLKKSAIYAAMRERDFPAPIQLSRKCVRWRKSEVEAWIDSRPRANGVHPAPAST